MSKLLNKSTVVLFVGIMLFLYSAAATALTNDFRIISATDKSLVFEFTPENWTSSDKLVEQTIYKSFQFDNSIIWGEPGEPAIPARNINIGIPLQGDVSVNIVESETSLITDAQLLPVAKIIPEQDGYYNQYAVNDSIYSIGSFFPQNIILQSESGFFRSQRVVTISLQPLQFNPLTRQVRQYKRLVVRVDFPSGSAQQSAVTARAGDEDLYQKLLLNYDQARKWRKLPEKSLRKSRQSVFSGNNWYKITIKGNGKTVYRDVNGNEEGIYKIDGATLQAAGVPIASIDPATIQIFNNGGREIPMDLEKQRPDSLVENAILVNAGNDGVFNSGDYLLFYGRSLEGFEFNKEKQHLEHYLHHFSEENVYWLTFGKQNGKRIETKSNQSASGAILETGFYDLAYFEREETNYLNSGANWLDRSMSVLDNTRSYSFDLQNVLPAAQTRFYLSLAAVSPRYHNFTIWANGNRLQDVQIFNSSTYNLYYSTILNYSVLMNGNNTVTVEYKNTSEEDLTFVDWVEIEYLREFKAVNDQLLFYGALGDKKSGYQISNFSGNTVQAFDITDFANVKLINAPVDNRTVTIYDSAKTVIPNKYLVLTANAYKKIGSSAIKAVTLENLRAPHNAQYIIITNDDFEQQALTLESIREDLHPEDRLETEVVKVSDVMNEFGWGITDPVAIRDFLVYAQKQWGQPRYVLLFGDGHYDYKDIRGYGAPNRIIPWETFETNEDYSRASDDMFVYTLNGNGMQMGIGRFNVRTVADAQSVVEKIRIYETEPEYGEWRNTFALVGDDELSEGGKGNETEHTEQAESISQLAELSHFLFKKIFLVEYPAVKTASISGITKPLAREAFLEQVNRGAVILNYVGHGNDQRFAHEKVFYGPTDYNLIQNEKRMALWIAATCEFARWDQPQEQSLAEQLVEVAGRGAIAMLASSRLVYSNNNIAFNKSFLKYMFADYDRTGLPERLGDALMLAKQLMYAGAKINTEKYLLIGDPAMRIAVPRYQTVIDDVDPDTIQALRKMSIKGHVENDTGEWTDYNGKILIRVLDSPKQKQYYTVENGDLIKFKIPGNTIFRGNALVQNGNFTVQFIVPKDISYDGADGHISSYFWDEENEGNEGQGLKSNLVVGGTATNLVDHDGPDMSLHFGEPGFVPGDFVPLNAVLHVNITDSLSGINTAGDIGHQIIMTLDDDLTDAKDITDFFEYNEGSYVTGVVKYPITGLKEGRHTIKIKAWDNSNNSSIIESEFVVINTDDLEIRNIVNYPNPLKSTTQFTFELSQNASVEIKIYSVAGRLLREFTPYQCQVGFNILPEIWDGTDQDGDKLANGLYLYKIKATTTNNNKAIKAEEIGKLLIVR